MEWQDMFKVIKGKCIQPRLLHPARILFIFDGGRGGEVWEALQTNTSLEN